MRIFIVCQPDADKTHWCALYLKGIYSEARRKGDTVTLLSFPEAVAAFQKDKPVCAGILSNSRAWTEEVAAALSGLGVEPLVIGGASRDGYRHASYVYMDYREATYQLIEYLRAYQKNRIALFAVSTDSATDMIKKDAFLAYDKRVTVRQQIPARKCEDFTDAVMKSAAAAKAGDEDALLAACHAIEDYFGFPKPNLLVKDAEVPGGMYSNMVAQLKSLNQESLLDDAMRLIPKVRRDAGLVPLVTPTSQIVGSQAVSLALDRQKGNPDYSNTSNQFISLIKGEYGKTPVAIDPAFREKITGSPVERPYDVSSYKKPENPVLPELGGVKLASNDEEYLLLELLPSVANGFLRKRRTEEYQATQATAVPEKVEEAVAVAEITGEVLAAPMGGKVISVNVKPGDKVKKGEVLLVYEAMKMENDIVAEKDVTIRQVLVKPDDVVNTDQPMIEFGEPVAVPVVAPEPVVAPVVVEEPKEVAPAEITGEVLAAPMGGKVITVNVKPGDKVAKGAVLLVYEAMKMENDIQSEYDGL